MKIFDWDKFLDDGDNVGNLLALVVLCATALLVIILCLTSLPFWAFGILAIGALIWAYHRLHKKGFLFVEDDDKAEWNKHFSDN